MQSSCKHFRKRSAILDYLRSTKAHPSAEDVFEALKPQIPDLSMGTVYRNIGLFRKQGLVDMIATVSGVERFDACTEPHVHFICTCCDRVQDLESMELPQSLADRAASLSGGRVQASRLSFTGTCGSCILNESGESA